MKKFIFVFVLAALTVFSFNMAFAGNIPGVSNELFNGSFEDGWTSWDIVGNIVRDNAYIGVIPHDGTWMAGNSSADSGSGKAYQVVDDTLSSGWSWDYNRKEVDLSAYVTVYNSGVAALDLAYIPIEIYSDEFAPAWDDSRWVDLGIVAESESNNSSINDWQYIEYHDIWDFQPRWIRVSVDTSCTGTPPISYAFVDDVNFESRCVPIPGALWLLGSGLIGLIGIRRRTRI